jgi:hypothetical protein
MADRSQRETVDARVHVCVRSVAIISLRSSRVKGKRNLKTLEKLGSVRGWWSAAQPRKQIPSRDSVRDLVKPITVYRRIEMSEDEMNIDEGL